MASIRERLLRLERRRHFVDWFVWLRFYRSLTDEELETGVSGGGFPDPIPNRPSSLDRLDRKTLLKLWEEDKRIHEGRSHEDLEYYADNGVWPEQGGRLHYSMQDGKLFVEWRNRLEEEGSGPAEDRIVTEKYFGNPSTHDHAKSNKAS